MRAPAPRVVVHEAFGGPAEDVPNLLVLLIDPISRTLFQKALPKTKQLLDQMVFISFGKYTAVGENSGPNLAKLYAGRALPSRVDIASMRNRSSSWIWDELRSAGYATFKAEDGCVRNSNMTQRPITTHGDALQLVLCFDFA